MTIEQIIAGTGRPTRGHLFRVAQPAAPLPQDTLRPTRPARSSVGPLAGCSFRGSGPPAGDLPAGGRSKAAPASSVGNTCPNKCLRCPCLCHNSLPHGAPQRWGPGGNTPSSGPGVAGDAKCQLTPTSFVWGSQTPPSQGAQRNVVYNPLPDRAGGAPVPVPPAPPSPLLEGLLCAGWSQGSHLESLLPGLGPCFLHGTEERVGFQREGRRAQRGVWRQAWVTPEPRPVPALPGSPGLCPEPLPSKGQPQAWHSRC